MVEEFRRRRDVMVAGLEAIPGLRCFRPRGAFYVFPNIRGTGIPSVPLANRLLDEAGLSCLSGTLFGPGGEGYLRFSCANSIATIQEALERLRTFLAAHAVRA